MKYLEDNQLSWLNAVLNRYEIGDRVVQGKLEAYSCKKAGSDKRLAKELELSYQQEMEALAGDDALLSCSPLGPLNSAATRKLLINLISTMNASFPDYDFSAVKPDQFYKEADFRIALQRINHDLAEVIDLESNGFVEKLWESVAECIKLDECDVYSYIPDMDSDPFSDGNLYVCMSLSLDAIDSPWGKGLTFDAMALLLLLLLVSRWSFNYFFYNKNQKKILYFTCMSTGYVCLSICGS